MRSPYLFVLLTIPLLTFPILSVAQEQPERVEIGPIEVEDASSVDLLKPLLPGTQTPVTAPLSRKPPTIDPMLRPHPIGPRKITMTRPSPRQISPSYLKSASRTHQYKKEVLVGETPASVTSEMLKDSDLQTFRDLTQRGGYFINRGGNLRYYTPSGDREDSLNAMRLKRSNYDRLSPTRGEQQSQRDARSLRYRDGRMFRNQGSYR